MRPGLLLLIITLSVAAIGYLELRHQAEREGWRAEHVRLSGRLEQAERLAEERAEALLSAERDWHEERQAASRLAELEADILDAAAELARLESDRTVAERRAKSALRDLMDQVRALTTIERDMALLERRRSNLARHVESVEQRVQQAEVGAAERQKRAESLDRDIAGLAIRREALLASLKTAERRMAETALAAMAIEPAEDDDPKAKDTAIASRDIPAPASGQVTEPVDDLALAVDEDREPTLGMYQFSSLPVDPDMADGGQGGLPPPSEGGAGGLSGEDEAASWAEDQYVMGLSLLASAEQSSGTRELNDAILAFKAVLGEWPKARDPMRFAITKSDLGYALALLGRREGNAAVLEQAAAACREALDSFGRNETPLLWAAAQHHLGVSLSGLAEVKDDQEARRASIQALEQAIAAFKEAGAETDARKAEARLRETYADLPAAAAQ